MERHLYSWIARLNIFKMSELHKVLNRFKTIPIKSSMSFFAEIDKTSIKFIWNHKGPEIDKTILKKEQNLRLHPS